MSKNLRITNRLIRDYEKIEIFTPCSFKIFKLEPLSLSDCVLLAILAELQIFKKNKNFADKLLKNGE
jgi:hypothetical protein